MGHKMVNLHPLCNSGESVVADVSFLDRSMTLELGYQGYGQHQTTSTIWFDNPRDMRNLANALIQIADEAEQFFRENP